MSDTAVLPDEESSEQFGSPLNKNGGPATVRPGTGRPGSMDLDLDSKDRRPFYRKPVFIVFILVLLVLGVVGTLYWRMRHFEDTDDANVDGHIVPINPQISAIVAEVHIADNQLVRQGEVLVKLDKTDYEIALKQRSGLRHLPKGSWRRLKRHPSSKAAVSQALAELESAQMNFDNADRELKRYQGLDERPAIPAEQDNALASQKTAAAAVAQAKARLNRHSAGGGAKANVTAAEGDYKRRRRIRGRPR